jgi:long-chain acyl-CoA synthetase
VFRDGWFLTGDLAQIDPDGFFSIVGRKKNVICRAGTNVYPEDVTAAVLAAPGVMDAVTVGAPDPLLSERVVVCVLPEAGASVDVQAIASHCRASLATEKRPNEILIVDELPRGPSGKVDLPRVKTMVAERLGAGTEQTGGSIADRVFAVASAAFKVPASALNPASNDQNTAGWDSLSHLEFVLALEKAFGRKFSPRDVMNIASLGDAIRIVETKMAA